MALYFNSIYFFGFLLYIYFPYLALCYTIFQRLQLPFGSAIYLFIFIIFIFSPPTVVMISQVVTGMIVRCICKCGWVWAPRAVCLWIHLSTLYQILLHRRLVSALPQHFTSSFDYKGVRDKGERFEVFQTRPHHPTTLTPTQQLTHAYSKTGPAQLPHPSPLTHRLTFNLKPFIFLFLFYFNFFRQCNPESTLPCYSFVWTCEW